MLDVGLCKLLSTSGDLAVVARPPTIPAVCSVPVHNRRVNQQRDYRLQDERMRLACQSCASQASCSYLPSTSQLRIYTAQQKPVQGRFISSGLKGAQRQVQVRAQEREAGSPWNEQARDAADRLATIAAPTCGLLLGGALLWLAGSEHAAQAADLQGSQPHFHPVSADASNLASSVCADKSYVQTCFEVPSSEASASKICPCIPMLIV